MKVGLLLYMCTMYMNTLVGLFQVASNDLVRSIILVCFSISIAFAKELVRWIIPKTFQLSLRVVCPFSIGFGAELYMVYIFPNINSAQVFLLIFFLQISTNLIRPLINRHEVWNFQNQFKRMLGITEQYPNQNYEDYVLRVSNDYMLTLLAQLSAHLVFVCIFIGGYYGYNRDCFPTIRGLSPSSFQVVVIFTTIQIFGIGLQIFVARAFIIRYYGHDPLKLCSYLFRHEKVVFTLAMAAAAIIGTSTQASV